MSKYSNYYPDMTKQALATSEVFSNYVKISLEQERLEKQANDEEIQKLVEILNVKVQYNEAFKKNLQDLLAQIDADASVANSYDPNFIAAIKMLNLH